MEMAAMAFTSTGRFCVPGIACTGRRLSGVFHNGNRPVVFARGVS